MRRGSLSGKFNSVEIFLVIFVLPLLLYGHLLIGGLLVNAACFFAIRKLRLTGGKAVALQISAMVIPCLLIGFFVETKGLGHGPDAPAWLAAIYLLVLGWIELGILDSLFRPKQGISR